MNETLEEMARALFQDWFVDFGPVRAKLEGREPYLRPELWGLFPDRLVDSELGEVPEGWEVGVLNDSIEILSGGTPKTSISAYWDGDVPWYTAKDAPALSDIFALITERSITQAGIDNSSTKVLPVRTTVITARGTVGRLACLGIPMAMNQTCYGIRGAEGYPDFFTYWSVRNTVSELQASRLLNKCVQVGNIRFRSLKPWSCWRKLCRSHGTFSPFGFCGPALLGAPGIAGPFSGHAIRAFGAVVA